MLLRDTNKFFWCSLDLCFFAPLMGSPNQSLPSLTIDKNNVVWQYKINEDFFPY